MVSRKQQYLNRFFRRTSLSLAVSLAAGLGSPVFSQSLTGSGTPPNLDANQVLVDFGDTADTRFLSSLTVQSIAFEALDNKARFTINSAGSPGNYALSIWANADGDVPQAKVTFPSRVQKFALNLGATDTTWTIEAFRGGSSLGTASKAATGAVYFADYFGYSDAGGIDYFVLSANRDTLNAEFFDNLAYVLISSLSPSGTLESMQQNAAALKRLFNLQSARIAQALSYDCTVFDAKNVCVAFAGARSDGKDGLDSTTGALILAHKPTAKFRFGGYIDQNIGSSESGGLKVKHGNPGYGVFGVWSQNADGSGVQVRAAANYSSVDIQTSRTAVADAEAGVGSSDIQSRGIELELSRSYALNDKWTARPYLGYRQTANKRDGYTEGTSTDVTAPLTYSSVKQDTQSVVAGARFFAQITPQTVMTFAAGIERDTKNSVDRYQASNTEIGPIDSIDMEGGKKRTRPTATLTISHDLDKAEKIAFSITHRKEAFESASTTSGMIQYMKGF